MRGCRLALGLLALAGCSSAEIGPSPPSGEGKTSIYLTDSPFPFDEVTRVDIHVKDIALSPAVDTSEGAPEWVTVATPDRTFNLLDLQNGATALLGEAVVPPGQYRAVRLTFDPARSSMTGRDGDLVLTTTTPGVPGINWQAKGEVPSLFAMVEEAMAIGENGADIVIDFDVGRSFLYEGAGRFTFLPYLRAITRSGSGGIQGRLLSADAGTPIDRAVVSVHVSQDSLGQIGPLLATTRSQPDGGFTASFLRPGRYQLVAEDLARGVTSGPTGVDVKAGRTAEAGDIRF